VTRSRPAIRLGLILVALVLGCSPAEKFERAAHMTRSWTATLRMTGEAFSAGNVPRVYASQVLRAALETRRRLAEQSDWSSVPRSTRSQLDDAIQELASILNEGADSLPTP
jgi:hypothetical protein